MTRPTLKVAVAFHTDANDAAAVAAMTDADWTDITSRVRAAPTVERSKRSTELDRFEAGEMKLTLDNHDGRFSPGNSSSLYWPNVTIYRMIRVQAVYSGTTYPLWQGYVERWPTRWLDPAQGLAEIECVDVLAIASQIDMSAVYTSEVLADAPTWYYPLTEASGAIEAANQSTVSQANAVIFHDTNSTTDETYAFGASIDNFVGTEGTGLSMVSATGIPYGMYGLRYPHISLTWSAWTIECWANDNVTGITNNLLLLTEAPNARYETLRVAVDGALGLFIDFTTPDGANMSTRVGPSLVSTGGGTAPHHIVLTWSTPTLTVYVDGSVVLSTAMASSYTGTRSYAMQSGSEDTIGDTTSFKQRDINAHAGTIAQVAVYPTVALNATRVGVHLITGLLGRYAQTSDVQAEALLGYAAWPSALQDIDAGSTILDSLSGIAGKSLLDCLQDIATTENGAVFATADGKLAVRNRTDRTSRLAPTVTFGSDVASGEIPHLLDGLLLDYDPTLVYNDISVTNAHGTARVFDAPSIRTYFPRSLNVSSRAAYAADGLAPAEWLLARYAQPSLRIENFTVPAGSIDQAAVPTLWPTMLALDINDRVLLTHRPMGQSAISVPGFVDQITHAIDPDAGTWNVVLQVSPLFHEYFALADPVDHTWDAASTPDAAGNVYLSY